MQCTKSAHQRLITYSILLLIHFLLLRLCIHKKCGLVTLGNLFCINSGQREQITQTMRDFRLPLRNGWELRSSGLQRSE